MEMRIFDIIMAPMVLAILDALKHKSDRFSMSELEAKENLQLIISFTAFIDEIILRISNHAIHSKI